MILKDAVCNVTSGYCHLTTLLCLYKMAAHLKTSAQVENPCHNPTTKTPVFFEHKNTGGIVERNQLSHINEMDLEQHQN